VAWHERDALPKGQSPQLLPCNWLAATAPQCNWLPACRFKSRAPIAAVPERARERPRHGRLREVGIRCGLTPTCAGAGRERPRRPRQQQFGTTATARRPQPSRPTDIPCFKSLGSPRASCGAGSRGECNASTDSQTLRATAGSCWHARSLHLTGLELRNAPTPTRWLGS